MGRAVERIMTIRDAQRRGDCRDCVWRVVGPGPLQCMAAQMAEAECPGKMSREEMRRKENEA